MTYQEENKIIVREYLINSHAIFFMTTKTECVFCFLNSDLAGIDYIADGLTSKEYRILSPIEKIMYYSEIKEVDKRIEILAKE